MPPKPRPRGTGLALDRLLLLPPGFYVIGLFKPDVGLSLGALGFWALGYPTWAVYVLWSATAAWPPGDTWGGIAWTIIGAAAWLLFIPLLPFMTLHAAFVIGWPLVYGSGVAALLMANRRASRPPPPGSGVGLKGAASVISALAALLLVAIIWSRFVGGSSQQSSGTTFWIVALCAPPAALFGFLAFKLYGAARAASRVRTPSAASPSAG